MQDYVREDRVQFKAKSIGVRLMAGKEWENPFPNKEGWSLQLKGGVMFGGYINHSQKYGFITIQYDENDTLFTYPTVLKQSLYYGSPNRMEIGQYTTLEGYIGLRKQVANAYVFKNMSIGLDFRYAPFGYGVSQNLTYFYANQSSSSIASEKGYYPKYLAIGLRFNIGLGWPK